MKKIFYLMSSLMLVFTACDPMEDVYDELDKAKKDNTSVTTELTADDYNVYKKDVDHPHVASGQYFTGEDEAAELVPAILNKRYPHLDNGATVTVTYNTPVFAGINNEVSSWEKHTISDEEYEALGKSHNNLSKTSEVYSFLDMKYPNPTDKQLVVLTFDLYSNGETSTITDSYYFTNGDWSNIYHVTSEDYASVKNTYGSFSGSDDSNLSFYFDMFLKKDVIVAKEGDFRYVSYYYYDSNDTKDRFQKVMAMYYNGTNWVQAVGATKNATLKFQKNKGEWVPDLSIQYTLVPADYTFVGDDNNNIATAAARENLRKFGNFSTYNWTSEQIVEAISAVLKLNFPSAEVGQKFKVTYDSYPGGLVPVTLIKREDGNFTPAEDGE